MKTNKILYQWDAGQKLTDCRGVFVDFVISGEVYRCDVVNGECIVPDELLQHPGNQTAYECMADNTLQEFVFSVVPRPLPPDYVYTPTEKLTFEGLVQKVEDTVADIIRRADTGEFDGYTPVKGKDYFTESEKNEMMQRVSDGAIGEFREVVDSATAGFNKNSSAKTNDYNANAEKKVGVYDSNAAEKLKAYNDNHTEKMTAYDTNAEQHTSDYNRNAEQKLEAYNQNHTEKVAEYNQNAETKTAEFDSNAAALQTEVDRLRGECDTLAAENRKQENRISALLKLNKGQTYDILTEEGEAASRTAPSGSKYVSVDKVGGKSVVWNQLWNYGKTEKEAGITYTYENHFYDVVKDTTANNGLYVLYNVKKRNKYYLSFEASSSDNIVLNLSIDQLLSVKLTEKNERYSTVITSGERIAIYLYSPSGVNCSYRVGNIKVINLSAMFGAGNEPTAEQFERMFPADYYPYSEPTIISSRTETITVGAESITTGFPELRSALAAHDYIDMDGGKVHRKIKAVRIDESARFSSIRTDRDDCCRIVFKPEVSPDIEIQKDVTIPTNIVADKLATITHSNYWSDDPGGYTGVSAYLGLNAISIRLQGRTDLDSEEKVKSWLKDNPLTVYYETKSEEVTDVTIPEALQEWLPVEPGGTVTFKNADESKQLAVPNAVSWVRKLDEVE